MGASPFVIDYRDGFSFPFPPDELWAAIEDVDSFERWWGWLSELHLEGGSLRSGAVLSGVVTPPVPYQMRVQVELKDCRRPSLIDALVHGDLEGAAQLLLEPDGAGTWATVSWNIEMKKRSMRMAARVAHPMLRWGHDRVVEATVRNFRSRAVRARGIASRVDPERP